MSAVSPVILSPQEHAALAIPFMILAMRHQKKKAHHEQKQARKRQKQAKNRQR